jgi:hypothetical protein
MIGTVNSRFEQTGHYRIVRIHLYQQKCAEAVQEFQTKFPNDFELPIALECAGRGDEALAAAERIAKAAAVPQSKASDWQIRAHADEDSTLAVLYARHGRRADAAREIQNAVREGEGGSHFHQSMYYIAAAYAQMNDANHALHWLERTAREGMPCYPLVASDPLFAPVRSDPGIRRFLDDQRREWEQRRRDWGSTPG